MTGQAKIELLLELKNKMKTGLSKAKENVNSNVKEMKDRLGSLKNKAVTVDLKDHLSPAITEAKSKVKSDTRSISSSLRNIKDRVLKISIRDKVSTGMSKIKTRMSGAIHSMKAKLTSLKTHHLAAFSAMREEIPMFDRALKLLGNPYVLITAGLVALTLLMGNAVGRAADFNSEFVNIQNLNLDKSEQSLKTYRASILDTAMTVGLSAKQTAKAFYDVQSATGKYGDDAKQIVASVGRYSIATGANLGDSINSTTKAMKAFKLGVKDIGIYLASNAKTVQVGITTFDELARVQTEYAGAAAGVGQSVNTANKLFAAFTSIAKDSTTAATMTKTAFLGLTQKGTIDGLKSIGISMYDAKGNMRDLDLVLKDVSAKFKTMSPKAIDETINKIGGPEGLKNLFIKLKTGSQDFFKTLEDFDSSKFNLDKALKNAMGDYNKLKELAANRFDVLMTKLGTTVLPTVVSFMEKVNNGMLWLNDNLDTVKSTIGYLAVAIGTAIVATKAWAVVQWIINAAMWANPIGAIIALIAGLVTAIVWVSKNTEGWGKSWTATVDMIKWGWLKIALWFDTFGKKIAIYFSYAIDSMVLAWDKSVASIKYNIELLKLKFKSLGQYIGGVFKNVGKALKLATKFNFSEAKKALSEKITTKASVEIEELKKGRSIQKEGFENRKQQIVSTKETAMQKTNASYNKQNDYASAMFDKAQSQFSIKMKEKATEKEEKKEKEGVSKTNPFGTTAEGNGSNEATSNKQTAAISNVVGSAKQVRNINIEIGAIHKGDLVTKNEEGEAKPIEDIGSALNDLILRTIRNIETSY